MAGTDVSLLQRGRDPKVTEGWCSVTLRPSQVSGFNGAVTRRSRKVDTFQDLVARGLDLASTGP